MSIYIVKDNSLMIVHIIYRLDVGGLENGLVNLINNISDSKYKHTIVCLTNYTDFTKRINNKNVQIIALHKKKGKDIGLYWRLWKVLRSIKPNIVHSRNLAALDSTIVSFFAGVKCILHGEHGRDIYDLYGKNAKYKLLRKLCSPFIDYYIALSQDLENWLLYDVGIKRNKVIQIYNGVDTNKFIKTKEKYESVKGVPDDFLQKDRVIIGTVGRLEPVKDQLSLVKAYIKLVNRRKDIARNVRLIIVGDGVLMKDIKRELSNANLENTVWLPGSREDVPNILALFDIFVLPSLGEGISNTILEAMACSLPIVATRVGGNPELVIDNETGFLVSPSSVDEMEEYLYKYISIDGLRTQHGKMGRKRVESIFSLSTMTNKYLQIYNDLIVNKEKIR